MVKAQNLEYHNVNILDSSHFISMNVVILMTSIFVILIWVHNQLDQLTKKCVLPRMKAKLRVCKL